MAAATALAVGGTILSGCAQGARLPPGLLAAGSPGISPGYEILTLPPRDLNRELMTYRNAGAHWLRVDLDWPTIEPRPGAWDWEAADRVVDAAHAAGLEVLLLPTKSPDWARATTGGQPSPDAFAAFIKASVAHYRDRGVHAWEIWNEPNTTTFWQARPDPARYAQFAIEARRILRENDSDSWMVLGGLAPAIDDPAGRWLSPTTFLEAVYDAGAGGSFDAVAVHPYSHPALPSETHLPVRNGYRDLAGVRRVLDDHGDRDVPVWVTEVGAPTGTSSRAVTPERQARILDEAFTYARFAPGMGPVFVYSGRDRGEDPADPEDNYGLVDRQFRPKPALTAFRAHASTVRSFGTAGR